jgi:hypothetical protein
MGTQRSTTESARIRIEAVGFRTPAGQDMSLEAEELNLGTEASDLLSVGSLRTECQENLTWSLKTLCGL